MVDQVANVVYELRVNVAMTKKRIDHERKSADATYKQVFKIPEEGTAMAYIGTQRTDLRKHGNRIKMAFDEYRTALQQAIIFAEKNSGFHQIHV